MMTGDENNLFYKFFKIKHLVFYVSETEDAHDFINDYHDMIHKIGIVEPY